MFNWMAYVTGWKVTQFYNNRGIYLPGSESQSQQLHIKAVNMIDVLEQLKVELPQLGFNVTGLQIYPEERTT